MIRKVEFEDHLRRAKDAYDLDVLLRWAAASLPAEVAPCGCCDMTCLRCQTARVVEEREALNAKLPATTAPAVEEEQQVLEGVAF
jgi:hypothetical protein